MEGAHVCLGLQQQPEVAASALAQAHPYTAGLSSHITEKRVTCDPITVVRIQLKTQQLNIDFIKWRKEQN